MPQPRKLGLPLGLLAGFFALNLTIALGTTAAYYLGWGAGIAVGIISAVAVVVWGFVLGSVAVAIASIAAMAAAILGSLSITAYRDAARGEILRDVSVTDAVNHPTASGFYFNDAVVKTSCQGRYESSPTSRRSSARGQSYYAVPVVSADGESDTEVAVWAVCGELQACHKSWDSPLNAGLRVSPPFDSFIEATKAAQERCGLTSHPNAVLIEWVASPEEATSQKLEDYWFAVKFWNIAWLVTAVGIAAVTGFLRRKKGEAVPPATAAGPA